MRSAAQVSWGKAHLLLESLARLGLLLLSSSSIWMAAHLQHADRRAWHLQQQTADAFTSGGLVTFLAEGGAAQQ